MKKIAVSVGYALGLPLILIGLWWVATAGGHSFFAVSPPELVDALIDEWLGPRLLEDVLPSIVRLLVGLTLAIVLGIAAGVVLGSVRTLRELFEPTLEFLRAVPPPVLIPVLSLLMGLTDGMRITVITLGCVWPILLNTVEGVRAVDEVLDDTCSTYQMAGWRRIRDLVLPSAMPQIMTGIRQSLSIGLILVVISEMFAASSGLGYVIIQFQRLFAIPEMWSGVALLGILGVLLSFLFQMVERRVLRWYQGIKENENAS